MNMVDLVASPLAIPMMRLTGKCEGVPHKILRLLPHIVWSIRVQSLAYGCEYRPCSPIHGARSAAQLAIENPSDGAAKLAKLP